MALKLNKENFIQRAKKVHGEKYDYSKVEYKNNRTKVCIICSEHGEFWQTPDAHLRGQGCPICRYIKSKESIRKKMGLTTENFIQKAKEIHDNKYNYSKVKYENTDTKVCIICPEHGEFWQTPHHHLKGCGCPECGRNDISELKFTTIIKNEFKNVISQYKPLFLKTNKKPQSLDIYLPDYNVAIEYQGREHFKPISRYGGTKEFEKVIERDRRKFELCKKNNVKIFYFSYENKKEFPENYMDKIYTLENEIIKDIKNIKND